MEGKKYKQITEKDLDNLLKEMSIDLDKDVSPLEELLEDFYDYPEEYVDYINWSEFDEFNENDW